MLTSKISALLVVLTLGTSAVITGCSADSATEDDASASESRISGVDIDKSEEHLAKAVDVAQRIEAGAMCDEFEYGSVAKSTVVSLLRAAIRVRDTEYFRTKVIAKKAVLGRVLAGSLEWQEIIGTYKPSDPKTLKAALETGVSIWDTNGGAYGNKGRIEFRDKGEASVFVLNVDTDTPTWSETKTTWRLEGSRLTLGTGEVYELEHTGEMLKATAPGAPDQNLFVSPQSECEA